ncbi:hypothetical protein AURDEDRAFT_166380 [Auricularia subglabra TFB-10046 SS5]|uniref:Uncharacterized protein n=1 Tax=Auricularia subglabra (strain TFB-10046 / SS5) TaxID=717982 RepID=J0WXS3_AURST|nr:hypothetical protein AURDEDRAFT_166380 [Auricularia subglabra TFB-10046 SS5]
MDTVAKRTIEELIELLVAEQWRVERAAGWTQARAKYGTEEEWRRDFVSSARRRHRELYLEGQVTQEEEPGRNLSQGDSQECRTGTGAAGFAHEVETDAELAFYDPGETTYDQATFITRSLAEAQSRAALEAAQQNVSLEDVVPRPDFELPRHYIWTIQSLGLPIPLGKFGQPFLKGWAWENFNPLRLWQSVGTETRVVRGDELWIRLAREAIRLPFEYRSHAQRIVVSEAHRVQPAGWVTKVLPREGEVAEVDVWHLCVNNALYMPLAVRRQYTYCARSDTLYREWDAADLGIYVVMRSCGPEGETKKEKREKKEKHRREGGTGVEKSLVAQWTVLVRNAVMWAAERWDGSEESIFEHLLTCGFARDRMLRGGDVHDYVLRMKELDEKLVATKDVVEAERERRGDSVDPKGVMARAKCLMELACERVPAGRPIVRCKVKDNDPIGQELRKGLMRSGRT